MPRKQQMALDTPQPTSTLAEKLVQLETLGESPLMRVVTREIEAIEQARARGLTYHQIARALAPQCKSANPKTLRECVYRVRKRQRIAHPAANTEIAVASNAVSKVDGTTSRQAPQALATGVSASQGSSSPVQPSHDDDGTNLDAAAESAARSDPGFIGNILRSTPDLDALARRYRATQRDANSPASNSNPKASSKHSLRPTPAHPVPEHPTGDQKS